MNYTTEMMQNILTNEKAQEIIDYVPPIYGNSYIALWIFQTIGIIMGELYNIADQLRDETNPATAEMLLNFWEDHYGLPRDSSMTAVQRQNRLISKAKNRGACNQARLESAISSALGGAEVEIAENVAKNKFLVNIRDVVADIVPAVAVVERMKPAHLIYDIQVATQTVSEAEIKNAIAMTRAEQYKVEVFG